MCPAHDRKCRRHPPAEAQKVNIIRGVRARGYLAVFLLPYGVLVTGEMRKFVSVIGQ